MPEQARNGKKTKKNKKKVSKAPFVYIIILLIAVVIMVCLVVRNNQGKEEDTNSTGENTAENVAEEDDTPLPEYPLIDMNNTENARIEGGTKENTSTKLAETKTYKSVTFTDIKLVAEGGISRLTATMTNNSTENLETQGIKIVFTNKDGSEYASLMAILPAKTAGNTNILNVGTTSDIINAYDFTIQSQD